MVRPTLSAVATTLAFVLVFTLAAYATAPFGVGLSGDSLAFVEWAREWRFGSLAPPLFPATLGALAATLHVAPEVAGRWLNALLAATSVALCGDVASTLSGRRVAPTALAVLTVALLVPLLQSSATLLTEAMFVSLTLGGLALLLRGRVRWAGVAIAAASLTRYAGVAFIAAAVIWLLSDRRWRDALAFSMIAATPLALWLTRNALALGSASGPRAPSRFSALENAQLAAGALISGFLPPLREFGAVPGLYVIASIIAAIAIVASVALGLRRAGSDSRARLVAIALLSFVSFTIASASVAAVDTIGIRLLLPAIPFIVVLIAASVSMFSGPLFRLLVAVWLIAVIGHGVASKRTIAVWRTEGVPGYSSRAWQASPALAGAIVARPRGAVYSNAPEVLRFHGLPARLMPERTHYNSDVPALSLADVQHSWPAAGATVIWFAMEARPHVWTPAHLGAVLHVRELRRFRDGSIYFVVPRRSRRSTPDRSS